MHPWELTPQQMVPMSKIRFMESSPYQGDVSSRFTPNRAYELPPDGSWAIHTSAWPTGHDVFKLVTLPVAQLVPTEDVRDNGRYGDAERYAQWLLDGLVPPPIHLVETAAGELRVINGHRRLRAHQLAGVTFIKAWLSPSCWHSDYSATGLTHEWSILRAIQHGEVPPQPVLDAYPHIPFWQIDSVQALEAALRIQSIGYQAYWRVDRCAA
jgi:hypothetical protein